MKKLLFVITVLSGLILVAVCGLFHNAYTFKAISGNEIKLCYNKGGHYFVSESKSILSYNKNISTIMDNSGLNIKSCIYSKILDKYIMLGNYKNDESDMLRNCIAVFNEDSYEVYDLPSCIVDSDIYGQYLVVVFQTDNNFFNLSSYDLNQGLKNISVIENYSKQFESSEYIYLIKNTHNAFCCFQENDNVFVWNFDKVIKEKSGLCYYSENYRVYWENNELAVYDTNRLILTEKAKNKPGFIFVSENEKLVVGLTTDKDLFAGNIGDSKYLKAVDLKTEKSTVLLSSIISGRRYFEVFE